jgi:hypothetical protein
VALTKTEVNERFYSTVGGEIVFETEAQGLLHPYAVARLLAAYARAQGRRELKLLELGANNCAFATSVLKLLTTLTVHGEVELDSVEYYAVEYARGPLETFLGQQAEIGDFAGVSPGQDGSPLVGTLTRLGVPKLTLRLVHAEAGAFVRGSGAYDFVVLNELLDDLASRAFFSDADGKAFELSAHAHEEGDTWRVSIEAEPAPDIELPPRSVTATSPVSIDIVRRAAALLRPGGMLLVHDYGFVDRHRPVDDYLAASKPLPDFVTRELPAGREDEIPREFFRIFGNDRARVVQITTDVPFGELVAELEGSGRVITLPHGNALLAQREEQNDLRKGDGIFLSEFGLLAPGDDFDAHLARLHAEQEEIRRRYSAEHAGSSTSVFVDLLYVKH